jgi:hypothetical protein
MTFPAVLLPAVEETLVRLRTQPSYPNSHRAAAGRVATDIYAESNPGMTRYDESDGQDQEFIDAKAEQIRTKLGVDPERWKAGIVARTEAILRTLYVWEAVEELAGQLPETEGAHAIPAKQVHRILRKAKEKAAVHP